MGYKLLAVRALPAEGSRAPHLDASPSLAWLTEDLALAGQAEPEETPLGYDEDAPKPPYFGWRLTAFVLKPGAPRGQLP